MKKNRNLLAALLTLMSLGSSMYGIFLPIYFMDLGIAYSNVIFFLVTFCIGGILGGFLSNIFMHRGGVKVFLILRGICEPAIILLINAYPLLRYPLPLLGIVYGFINFSFWNSIDVLTLKSTESHRRGSQQGSLFAGMYIAVILAPYIGGFIISASGYALLYLISFLLVLAGGAISFFIKADVHIKKKINLMPTLKGKIGRLMLINFLRGFSFAITIFLYGLLAYGLLHDEYGVGIFGLACGIAALAAILVAGKVSDRLSKRTLVMGLFAMMCASWIILSAVHSITVQYILLLLIYFLYKMIDIPLNTMFLDSIEKMDSATLVAERLIAVCSGAAVMLLLAVFFSFGQLYVVAALTIGLAIPIALKLKA